MMIGHDHHHGEATALWRLRMMREIRGMDDGDETTPKICQAA